jgi:hypothetical protein
MSRIALVLVMGGLLLGASKCGEDEPDGPDDMPAEGGGVSGSGAAGDDGPDPVGEECGARTCGEGLVCCNASCGVCTKPGMFCTQQACDDGGGGAGGVGDPGGGGAGDPPSSPGPACGGITGKGCPGLGTCADDPSDSCDPDNGGADCGGRCECKAMAKCRAGQKWDASPEVCSCVGGDDEGAGSGGSGEAGAGGKGGSTGGEACGSMTCGDGEVCCNPSCGICTKPGEGCIKKLCEPTDPPTKDPQRCGGFGGFPCPGLGDCVDDPSDDCDPKNGGADCGGICKCTAGLTALCEQGMPCNDDPHGCSCAAPPGSGGAECGKNTCADGQFCCNASCGICAPKGGACIQIACL